MLRYGTYIFGGECSLYVVIDDGACLVPQPDRRNAKCVFRVIGVDISLHFRKWPSRWWGTAAARMVEVVPVTFKMVPIN